MTRARRRRPPRPAAATPAPTAQPQPEKKPIFGLKPVQDLIDGAGQLVPNAVNGATGGKGKGSDPANDLLDFLLKP